MTRSSNAVPQGAWVAHGIELLMSPAWKAKPHTLVRILDRLEVEHMRHAGTSNGQLHVSYGQFQSEGISRRAIRPAITLGEKLGLLKIHQAGSGHGPLRDPNTYELTYLPIGKSGAANKWKSVTQADANKHLAAYRTAIGVKK